MTSQNSPAHAGILARLSTDRVILLTILVGGLGYFVDVFDLLLFAIVRVQSLKDMGVQGDAVTGTGILILNIQMAGLLLGGILWGVLGDRLGRLSVLFGSILLYSAASILNAYVHSVPLYAALRFITGLGLAGELGVGVTLASELLPRAKRGLGTTFIGTVGVLGATAAAIIAAHVGWRDAYLVGGVMGLVLLVLRINLRESGLFSDLAANKKDVSRGNIFMIFRNGGLLRRYLSVILIGAPTWGVIGLFIAFTPEFAKDFHLSVEPTAGNAVLWCYVGTTFGSFFSGALSQRLRSRRKSIAASLGLLIVFLGLFYTVHPDTLAGYYTLCGLLGVGAGYWTMFVQVGAEQFGTNIRATAATTLPNIVRGLTIPMTSAFRALTPFLGVSGSGLAVIAVVFTLAFISLFNVKETFDADLDYLEV